eukprot:6490548-Amphidinium_carterae.2
MASKETLRSGVTALLDGGIILQVGGRGQIVRQAAELAESMARKLFRIRSKGTLDATGGSGRD